MNESSTKSQAFVALIFVIFAIETKKNVFINTRADIFSREILVFVNFRGFAVKTCVQGKLEE